MTQPLVPAEIRKLFDDDRSPAAVVALLYTLLGGLWITYSDRAIAGLATDPAHLTTLQTWKGWAFVAATATLLFFLMWGALWLRRRSLAAQLEKERFLTTLLKNLPGAAYRCRNEPRWRLEFVSHGVAPLTGYAPASFLEGDLTWEDLMHPADRERVWSEVQAALDRGGPFRIEYRIVTRGGRTKWVWEQGRAVPGATGEEGEFLEGFLTDITALKAAASSGEVAAEGAADGGASMPSPFARRASSTS